jgi:hypothetical protein
MICVGKKKATTMLREPARRTSEVRGLAGLVDAYVAFDEGGPRRSAFFGELDSREKASFSYRLGMGLALLLAQRVLSIPWLMHAEPLLATGSAEVAPEGGSRTELVGLSREGDWHLVKAKARSSELTDSIVDDTLADVGELAAVNAHPPAGRHACVTALGETPFRAVFARADEPDVEPGDERPSLRVDPGRYITEYYAQFTFLTSLDTQRRELEAAEGCGNLPPVVASELEGTGYALGLMSPLHDALLPPGEDESSDRTLDEAVPGEGGWAPEDPEAAREAGLSVGADGVVVQARPPTKG